MNVARAIAEILQREGVTFLIGYPVNPIIEAAAEADIRTIIVRQERTGLHMADAVSRVTSGAQIGVFVMQHGPGTENAFGGWRRPTAIRCPSWCCPPAIRAT
jgi:acetolactate synthase-1/2/3 large subunit